MTDQQDRAYYFRARSYESLMQNYRACDDCGERFDSNEMHAWGNDAGEREGYRCDACYDVACGYRRGHGGRMGAGGGYV